MSQAGPSRDGGGRTRRTSDLIGTSPEFGDFTSAQPSSNVPTTTASSSQAHRHSLKEDDLLGSFDELDPLAPPRTSSKSAHDDLLDDIGFTDSELPPAGIGQAHTNTNTNSSSSGSSKPIHVTLPPRPDEISADYVPPRSPRSPRRLSSQLSLDPGSPPRVSDAGRDIVFHPSSPDFGHFGPLPPANAQRLKNGASSSDEKFPKRPDPSSPAQSRLLNTLATTTKLASKWKSALDTNLLHHPHPSQAQPQPHFHQARPSSADSGAHATPTALPIEITHETPFATPDQIAGSYVPPSGAPGFMEKTAVRTRGDDSNDEWAGTKLIGRRETTDPVLMGHDADQLRSHLPARKRLAGQWTLLFSLDQHGASLATLYRQVERYASTHKGSGNILIVRDGRGNKFGIFMNEAILKREGTYYGSGECFTFKFVRDEIRTFPWTGKNQYFALCEHNFISFGGGSGAYGLILDSSFSRNSSATCPTFDNEVLCTPSSVRRQSATTFDCIALEVWGT